MKVALIVILFKINIILATQLRWSSAGLVIERLQNVGSTPDVVRHRCALKKDAECHLGSSSPSVVVTQPDKGCNQDRSAWSDMTDTK